MASSDSNVVDSNVVDSNVVDERWALHYAEASRRRRGRGWHRREDGAKRGVVARWRIYAVIAALVALVVVALMVSK